MKIPKVKQIGLISDTHGYLSEMVAPIFQDLDLIIHAGDLDQPKILRCLGKIGPLVTVRGNMDRGSWAEDLKPTEIITVADQHLYVLHDIQMLDLVPESIGIKAVISGHTHQPLVQQQKGVWYINPGSAAYPRNGHSPSVAVLQMSPTTFSVRHYPV